MLNDEICKVRDELNKSIITGQDYEVIYKLSVQLDELIDKYYTKKTYTREFASEVIEKLKNEGNEICLITARNSEEEPSKDWTADWLKENNIYYDKLIFTSEKLEYCRNNNIDIMVEDCAQNILKLSTEIPVICLDTRYNQECKGENITRCYSWYDIYSKIKKIH